MFIDGVHPATDQSVALRIVVLADRLYDASIPVTVFRARLDEIFTPEMLAGGYKKKYFARPRACSHFLVSRSRPASLHACQLTGRSITKSWWSCAPTRKVFVPTCVKPCFA